MRMARNTPQGKRKVIQPVRSIFIPVLTEVLFGCLSAYAYTDAVSTPLSEYEVKAAFVYKFRQFIEWPQRDRASLVFCVTGQRRLFEALELIHRGRSLAAQQPAVKWVNRRETLAEHCDVLFIGALETKATREILMAVQDSSVLTIGESKGFLEAGGIVNFVVEQNNVRFEFNLRAAQRARLTISSRLLHLATRVCEVCPPGR